MEFIYFPYAFFWISILFLIIILSLLYLVKPKLCCDCEICQTYINSSWTLEFPNLCDWFTFLLQNSPTKTIHVHVLGNTITANPDNVEYMLKKRFENYPKGKTFSSILGDFLGRGIFNVDGDLWKFQRKMASLELGRTSLRSYALEVVNYETKRHLIPLLTSFTRKDAKLDLQDVFRRFAFDTVCQFSFGLDPKCLEVLLPMSEFVEAFDLASNLSAKRAMVTFPWVWKLKRVFHIGNEKKLREAIKKINVMARKVIEQKRKKGYSTHKDLLSRFMVMINDEKYLRDIVVSFILAGRDTIASSLTSLFMLLANHPRVELAILGEVEKVIGAKGEITNIAQLEELHYLQATIYESMRLYPPIQFDSKFCLEDDVLPDGTIVKKGTRVTYHPYAMARMEEIWGRDCLQFKPERWLRDGVFFQENLFKYPVFQAGPRTCLGKEIAILELKSATISLIRKFHIKLATSSQTPKFSPGLTATISGGLPVLVQESTVPL